MKSDATVLQYYFFFQIKIIIRYAFVGVMRVRRKETRETFNRTDRQPRTKYEITIIVVVVIYYYFYTFKRDVKEVCVYAILYYALQRQYYIYIYYIIKLSTAKPKIRKYF